MGIELWNMKIRRDVKMLRIGLVFGGFFVFLLF